MAACGGKRKKIRILKRKEVVNEEANVADVDTSSTWHQQEESSSLVNEVVGFGSDTRGG